MSEYKKNGQLKEDLMLSPETIDRIYNMHEILQAIEPVITVGIPQMTTLLSSVVTAQSTIAVAAESMAATSRKAENRYEKLEGRLQSANDRAAGRGQIPLLSHYIVLVGTVLTALLIVLYVNKQTIEASLTSVKIQQHVDDAKGTK